MKIVFASLIVLESLLGRSIVASPGQADLENRKAGDIKYGTPSNPLWAGSMFGEPLKPQIYGLILEADTLNQIIFSLVPSFGMPVAIGIQTVQDTVVLTIDKSQVARSTSGKLPADSFHLFITQTDSTRQYISLADTARYYVARRGDSLFVSILKRCGFVELAKGAFIRVEKGEYLAIGRKEK